MVGRKWKWISLEAEHQKHGKFSLGCEKNFLITIISLVFVVLKQSLLRRSEFHLYLGSVLEFLLVNSATRRFSMAVGFEGKFFIQISLFYDAFIDHWPFGSAGIWGNNLDPASRWKCWKSHIRSPVLNKIYWHKMIYWLKTALIKYFAWMGETKGRPSDGDQDFSIHWKLDLQSELVHAKCFYKIMAKQEIQILRNFTASRARWRSM